MTSKTEQHWQDVYSKKSAQQVSWYREHLEQSLAMLDALPDRDAVRGGKISKMTIFHVYTAVNGALNDAEQRRLIERNPCKDLRRGQKPKRPKRSEVQRGYFTKEHVELLISDPGVSEIDRLFYAILFLTGTRSSEAIGLCFEDWNREAEPLGRIHLRQQWHDQLRKYMPLKGKPDCPGPPRDIPVHPTLAKMLSEWKLSGFEKHFGRKPESEDPIIPSVRGAEHRRTLRNSLKHLQADCKRLDIRPVGGVGDAITQHQSRNSFITLAAANGAPEAWIKRITHNASGDVLAGYMVNDWDAMCRVVSCIPVQVQTYGEVIAMPRAVGGNTSNEPSETDGTHAPGANRLGLNLASSRIATKKPLITEAHLRSGRDSKPPCATPVSNSSAQLDGNPPHSYPPKLSEENSLTGHKLAKANISDRDDLIAKVMEAAECLERARPDLAEAIRMFCRRKSRNETTSGREEYT